MTAIERTIIVAALIAAIGSGLLAIHQNSALQGQFRMLQQQQLSLSHVLATLKQEHRDTENQLAALRIPRSAIHTNVTAIASSKANSEVIPSSMVISEIERALGDPTWGGRDAAFERIKKSIALADIPRAMAFLASRQGLDGVETPLFTSLASEWGTKDHDAAIAWANSLQDTNAHEKTLVNILDGWSGTDRKAAADYAQTLPAGSLQKACIGKVLGNWSFSDGQGAIQWVTQLVSQNPESEFTDKAVDSVIFWAQGQCPSAMADMLDATGSTNLVQTYGETVASIWLNRDPSAARAWIEQVPLSDEVKQRLLNQK